MKKNIFVLNFKWIDTICVLIYFERREILDHIKHKFTMNKICLYWNVGYDEGRHKF